MKFAIVISTYQRPDGNTPIFLKKTLESVLNQTYQNFKIFLIGDKYENQEEFLLFKNLIPSEKLYIENLPNAIEREKYKHPSWELWWSGGANAINYGIDVALKENFTHVCLLDHDDTWNSNHLELINKTLSISNPSLIFTQGWYNNSKFPPLDSSFKHKLQINPNLYHELSSLIKAYPSVPHECSFIKSSVCIDFSQINLKFRDKLAETGIGGPSDADLWMRLRELVINEQIQPSMFIESLTVNNGGEGYSRK
jgi:glycosyltransferase involved in cell wall biosynthesis